MSRGASTDGRQDVRLHRGDVENGAVRRAGLLTTGLARTVVDLVIDSADPAEVSTIRALCRTCHLRGGTYRLLSAGSRFRAEAPRPSRRPIAYRDLLACLR